MISVPIDDRGCATGARPGHGEGQRLTVALGISQRVAKEEQCSQYPLKKICELEAGEMSRGEEHEPFL